MVIEGVNAQREDDRLRVASSRGNGGDMESRGLIGFPHVTGPFRMKVETALDAGLLRLRGFEAAVTRIDVTLENDFGVGKGHCVNRASFDQTHWRALDCTGDADFIAALWQDDIIEAGAGQ